MNIPAWAQQETQLQATFVWKEKTYFLFPKQVTIYDNSTNKVLESKPIAAVFEKMPFEQIDGAVCYASKGKAYFFSGDKYARFDMKSSKMDEGYPRPISEWGDLLEATTTAIEKAKAPKKSIQFFEGSWEETLALSKQTGKPIFVNIYTSGFAPCRKIARLIFTDEKVADFYNENFINVRIGDSMTEISLERKRGFMKKHNWKYFPTRFYINEKNEKLKMSDGCVSAYGMISMGKEVLAGLE